MMLVRSFPRPEKLPLLLLFVHFPPLKKEYRSFSGVIFVGAKAPCQENPPFLAANPPTSCLLGAAGGLVAFPAQVLLLPLPPAWCEIHPAWRRRKRSWLLGVATQILMHLLVVVY